MSWNIVPNNNETYTLLNGSDTIIRLHKQIKIDVVLRLMSSLEEIGFPISYSRGLKEIYFTYLWGYLAGDYDCDGIIRVSCNNMFLQNHAQHFIHEIGHHVDESEAYSEDLDLQEEWKHHSSSFIHVDIDKDPAEYFAMGFDRWYTGGNLSENPLLTSTIQNIHNKYTNT